MGWPIFKENSGSRMLPDSVDFVELPALDRHLLHDVLRVEDGLEVEPRLLAPKPRVQDVLHAENDH